MPSPCFSGGRSGDWSCIPISKNFPQFVEIRTVKSFDIVNKAEVDVFLELSCFFNDPTDTGNLISGFSAFSKSSLNIWKFMEHVLVNPGLENFEHYFTSVWDECNCVGVWAFFGIAFLWDWNENWLYPVLCLLLSFLNVLEYWVQHFHSLRNLYAGQEATVRTGHGTTDWFQIGKGVRQGYILSPCLFNFYAEYIMRNTGLEEAQAGIKISGKNINNLRYADDTNLT